MQYKKIIFSCFLMFVVGALSLSAQEKTTVKATTTYYLIRHAEKVRSNPENKNPDLTEKGLTRAQNWAHVLGDITLDAVYSTDYNRTIQTATPVAKSKDLEVLSYNPRSLYDASFKAATQGKKVLVVGHSNTTPAFVNKILGKEKYPSIDDHNNGNLYVVTVAVNGKTSSALYHID